MFIKNVLKNIYYRYTSLDPIYQYFSDPKKGGFDEAADYCPIPYPFGTGNCQDKGYIVLFLEIMKL